MYVLMYTCTCICMYMYNIIYIYTVYICIICMYIYIETYPRFSTSSSHHGPTKKPGRPDREPAKVDLMKFHRGKVSCL